MTWVSRATNTATVPYWTACGQSCLPPQCLANTRIITVQSQGSDPALGAHVSLLPTRQITTIATVVTSSSPGAPISSLTGSWRRCLCASPCEVSLGGSIPDRGPAAEDLAIAKGRVMRVAEQQQGVNLGNASRTGSRADDRLGHDPQCSGLANQTMHRSAI